MTGPPLEACCITGGGGGDVAEPVRQSQLGTNKALAF